jgi:hypothetical protein
MHESLIFQRFRSIKATGAANSAGRSLPEGVI